jgi:hypothetical protein
MRRLPKTECLLGNIKHFPKLVISTVLPIMVLVLLAIPSVLRKYMRGSSRDAGSDEKDQRVLAAFSFSVLSFLFLIFPLVCMCFPVHTVVI